jgi:hypothetical protein
MKSDPTQTVQARTESAGFRLAWSCGVLLLFVLVLLSLAQPATLHAQPPPNRVLELDGTNSFVELPPNIFNDLTEATVEGWVKWRDLGGDWRRFFSYGEHNHDMGIQAFRGDDPTGGLNSFIADHEKGLQRLTMPGIIRPDAWCHIAAVFGKGGMKLYFNGVLVATNSYPGSFSAIQNGARFRLGRSVVDGEPGVNGQLDEVRVWAAARTEEQIRQTLFQRLTGREEGLVGLWNFDDGKADDATPAGHHGKLVGQAHTVAAELPAPEQLPRPVVIHGRLLNWRQNPRALGWSLTFVRIRQSGRLVRTLVLAGDEGYSCVVFGPDPAIELQAFDWWGHRWQTNAVLQPGDRFQFDLAADWKIPQSAIPSEWILDALRDESVPTRGAAAILPWFFGARPIDHEVFAELARLTGDKNSSVRANAELALELAQLPSTLDYRLIGWHRALGWFLVAFLTPFALLHLLIFLFDRQNRTALLYSIFSTLAALVAWFYMKSYSAPLTWTDGVTFVMVIALQVAGLGLLYPLNYLRYPRRFWWFLAWPVLLGLAGLLVPNFFQELGQLIFALKQKPLLVVLVMSVSIVMLLDTVQVILRAVWNRRDGARIVGAGFAVFALVLVIEMSRLFQVLPVEAYLGEIYSPVGSGRRWFVGPHRGHLPGPAVRRHQPQAETG